ncbi:MAG TPA: Ig-like domain-containing protein [Gammaproteobacteria bacterium]
MNATRLFFSLALLSLLALAGCGGGSSPITDTGVVSPAPDAPDGGDAGDNDGSDSSSTDDGQDNTDGDPSNNDGDDGNAPEPPSDPQKPEVVSTDPAPYADTVNANVVITVVFDEMIDPESATPASIRLAGPNGDVGIDVSVSETRVHIKPQTRLAEGAAYTATVSSGVRDVLGNAMGSDYSWQFVVEKTLSGVCADFYDENFALREGKLSLSVPYLAKPARGVRFADPVYGSCMVRATNAQGELGVTWARNNYSRIQPFNADGSLYLVFTEGGRWFINATEDTTTLRELQIRGGNDAEPQWHPTNPDVLYILEGSGGLTIREYHVWTDEVRVIADLRNVNSIAGHAGKTSITEIWPAAARAWTRWEGSPSADGRYWGFMVQTDSGAGLGMITYDLEADVITGVYDYDTDGGGVPQPDHISMSPSGKYVVPSWANPACSSMSSLGTRNNPCGVMAFSRDFSRAVGLAMNSTHSDIGIDANGRDVLVAGDYNTGWVTMWDLETGARTKLWYIWEPSGSGTAMHLSARNFDKPGWFLVSTYNERIPGWYANKIMAVEMKADPRILNIANTFNNYVSYWTEPHAAVNRDFTRILFNSNWGTYNSNTDAYMIALPYDAIPQ